MKFNLLIASVLCLSMPSWATQYFSSPEDAASTLYQAIKSGEQNQVLKVLGDPAKDLLESGDAAADKAALQRFVEKYDAQHALSGKDGRRTLEIGQDQWPFPIPIVSSKGHWYFDTAAGRNEVVLRRIGTNELAVIESLRAYVDAQQEYYLADPENKGLLQYAQQIFSQPGRKNGLYWPAQPNEKPSPLGEQYAAASASAPQTPYHGYYYRVLNAQGAKAKGGAYSYLANGAMIGGFALLAYPAQYGKTGRNSFIVNHDGVVYQRDWGKDTAKKAQAVSVFNPDQGWTKAD
jgi:hypothetical protein